MSRVIPFLSSLIFALCAPSAYGSTEGIFTFPQGSATPAEVCGECHGAIYREYLLGVGSDAHSGHPSLKPGPALAMPAKVSSSGTAHAGSGFPVAGTSGEKTAYCNGCHSPKPFDIAGPDAAGKTHPPAGNTDKGHVTCVGCHLTKDGRIRTPHKVRSPHLTVVDSALQSSALCAQCHGFYDTDKRVVGKEMQTFYEWQQDYFQPGLGKQQCQDCHMPRTLRVTAEGFDENRIRPRAVGRHLWTGATSWQRHLGSLSLTIVHEQQGARRLSFHVSNIGAGHSVPTGMSRRAVYLRVEVVDKIGNRIADRQWMFAPFKGDRPEDKAFLEEDKRLGAAGAALALGDAQGPHESSIRAGEERVLEWEPPLAPGEYTVKAALAYTLDRFAEHPAADDGSVLSKETLAFSVR